MTAATESDVQARFERPMTTDEQARSIVFLADIETKIKARIPDFDTKITDPVYLSLVVAAEAEAVVRKLRNPAGYTYEAEGNYSYTIGSGNAASSDLTLTDDEWASLGVVSAAFTVTMQPPSWTRYLSRWRQLDEWGWWR